MVRRIGRGLVATSEEIEQEPLWRRPRFMAATWGGLLVCKAYAMAFVSFEAGLAAFVTVLAGGAALAAWRFGAGEAGERRVRITPRESSRVAA